MKVHNPFRVAFVATLGVGLGLLLITSIQTLSTILLYVGTALFLSLGLDPIISWLEKRKFPRWAAVVVTILAVLLAFAGIVLMILPILVTQVGQLIKAVTDLVGREGFWTDVENWVTSTFPNLQLDVVLQQVQQWALDNAGTITGSVLGFGIAFFAGLTGAFIVLILTIYFTAATPALKRSVYQLVPASKRPRFIDLGEQITDSVGYYVIGQLSLGVINGILSAIFLSIIGAPVPCGARGRRVLLLADPARRHAHRLDAHRARLLHPARLPHDRADRGDLLPDLHADRGVRDLTAHHEPRRLGPRGRGRHRGAGRRLPAGPARRAHRDPRGREHPDHLPAGGHPTPERALSGAAP